LPIYDFKCQAQGCWSNYELLRPLAERDSAICPRCGSSNQKRLISAPARRTQRSRSIASVTGIRGPLSTPGTRGPMDPLAIFHDCTFEDGPTAIALGKPEYVIVNRGRFKNIGSIAKEVYLDGAAHPDSKKPNSPNSWKGNSLIKITDPEYHRVGTVLDLTKDSKLDAELVRGKYIDVNTVVRERDNPQSIIQQLGLPDDTSPTELGELLLSLSNIGAGNPAAQDAAVKESALGKRLQNYSNIANVFQGVIALANSPLIPGIVAQLTT